MDFRNRIFEGQRLLMTYVIALAAVSAFCVVFDIRKGTLLLTSVLGFAIAIISIVLLLKEKFSVDLHIAKVRLFVEDASNTPARDSSSLNRFRITTQVSNEGGRIANNCQCYIQSTDESQTIYLDFVPVDTDVGRPDPLPRRDKFPLLPKKHIFVRGYITARENLEYQIFLTDGRNTKSFPDRPFRLPDWIKLRESQKQRRQLMLPPIPF